MVNETDLRVTIFIQALIIIALLFFTMALFFTMVRFISPYFIYFITIILLPIILFLFFNKDFISKDLMAERLWAIIGEHSALFNEPNSCGDPDFEQVIGDLTDLYNEFINKIGG